MTGPKYERTFLFVDVRIWSKEIMTACTPIVLRLAYCNRFAYEDDTVLQHSWLDNEKYSSCVCVCVTNRVYHN